MTRIGFLHTSVVHVATFADLLRELAPDVGGKHVVDVSLLAEARSVGLSDSLRACVLVRLREAADGCHAVLCTCSTIGSVAERLSSAVGVPVLRVDRPMAAAAVAIGVRIGIVAALESTFHPTRELIVEEAAALGAAVEMFDFACLDAWTMLEDGAMDGFLDRVAQHVDHVANSVDVVVLAQASMASAARRCRTSTPVLSSPRAGLEATLFAARTGVLSKETPARTIAHNPESLRGRGTQIGASSCAHRSAWSARMYWAS